MENEDDLIHWLKGRAEGLGGELIGDDAAVLPAGGPWAVTVDTQLEGVHFFPGLDPAILAQRLLAVNLSDLAAMGAEPAYGFLTLAGPGSWDRRRFFDTLLAACEPWGLKLAGGDLAYRGEVAATLTLMGRPCDDPGDFLRRHLARPGERLWLGGSVGLSALGFELVRRGATLDFNGPVSLPFDLPAGAPRALAERAVRRHLLPRAQLDLGRRLVAMGGRAAMDISDGLAKDLHRLCRASGVAAHIDLAALDEPPGFTELNAIVAKPWLDLALGGGEDYVLCFSLQDGLEPPQGCLALGRLDFGSGVFDQDGRRIPAVGWDHLTPG